MSTEIAQSPAKQAEKSRREILVFLGRRLERLLFGGIALVGVGLFLVVLAAASRQIAEDHTETALTALLEGIQIKKQDLDLLFAEQQQPKKTATQPDVDHLAQIATTRAKLGLPPAQPNAPLEHQKTYSGELQDIVASAAKKFGLRISELLPNIDNHHSPDELSKSLKDQISNIQNQPTSIWGIQTPRSLHLKYLEQDYRVPYEVLCTLIMVPYCILVIGWFSAIYITRQRELLFIRQVVDYKLIFPHILNFLPVRFELLSRVVKVSTAEAQLKENRLNRRLQALIRTLVISLLALPLIYFFAQSLMNLWGSNNEPSTTPYIFGAIAILVMITQFVGFVFQEWMFLIGKDFTDKESLY